MRRRVLRDIQMRVVQNPDQWVASDASYSDLSASSSKSMKTSHSSSSSSSRRSLGFVASLCLASVTVVTLLNYYGLASVSKAQNQLVLEDIRDLLQPLKQLKHDQQQASKAEREKTSLTDFPADLDGSDMHIVFSASCGQSNRVLQQTVVQLTAIWAGQKGPITQIRSCRAARTTSSCRF